MNLNYLVQKKHLFKKRIFHNPKRKLTLRIGTNGLFSLKKQRFELVYMRGFKKILKKRSMRKRVIFVKRRYWVFIRPNCILTAKSVNSRMGAGVGAFIRIAKILEKNKTFVEFYKYSPLWIRKIIKWTRYRYPLKFLPVK